MSGTPTEPPEFDDLDARYRALAAEPGAPPARVRVAVLREAHRLAARGAPAVAADTARSDARRRHARRRWLGAAAAAAVAGLAVLPLWRAPHAPGATVAPALPPAAATPSLSGPAADRLQPPVVQAPRPEAAAPRVQAPILDLAQAAAPPAPPAAPDVATPGEAERRPAPPVAANGPVARLAAHDAASASARSGAPSLAASPAPVTANPSAALWQAAAAGDVDRVRSLLGAVDIDARDGGGRSALLLATLGGHLPTVELLLGNGADPNAADGNGDSPLEAAKRMARPDLVELLERAGAR